MKGAGEKLVAAFLGYPQTGKMSGLIPQTQMLGPRPAASHFSAVTRVMATMAVRWLRTACAGYFEDFGSTAALQALAKLIQVLGFDFKIVKSERGTQLEPLGLTAEFTYEGQIRKADLYTPPAEVKNPVGERQIWKYVMRYFRPRCENWSVSWTPPRQL